MPNPSSNADLCITPPEATSAHFAEFELPDLLALELNDPLQDITTILPNHEVVRVLSPIQFKKREPTSQYDTPELWDKRRQFRFSIAAKLREAGHVASALVLERCRTELTHAVCVECGEHKEFWNRCDKLWCPECQVRLARLRKDQVEWWSLLVRQPKHVVLTCRNTPDLTKGHVRQFKEWFRRLRRTKFAEGWRGGCWSLEVTNEQRGWHLHLHALIDADYIDVGELKTTWCKINAGAGYIAKVKDCREGSYLQEIVKYAVKGSGLAKWSGPEIAEYVAAFENEKSFGTFGTLFGHRHEWKEFIESIRVEFSRCECGCKEVRLYSETEWVERDLIPLSALPSHPRPPPVSPQLELPV